MLIRTNRIRILTQVLNMLAKFQYETYILQIMKFLNIIQIIM